MQAIRRAKVSGLDLALDERRGHDIQVSLHLGLGIGLKDALLDLLHIAHERTEFVRTAVEPLGERGERLRIDLVRRGEERLRFLADGLDVLRRLCAFALLLGSRSSHRIWDCLGVLMPRTSLARCVGWLADAMMAASETLALGQTTSTNTSFDNLIRIRTLASVNLERLAHTVHQPLANSR